jgi:hypothetical protein
MTHAWCRDPSRDEQVRAAEDGRTAPLPTLEECIVAPFADAAERSSTVSKTGEGQSGMRTERVTLEVTHNAALSAREWHMWRTIFDPRYGESVRVVEEPHFDDLAQVAMQRDAAIRELSAAKLWQDCLAMQRNEIRDERDALKARVAALEAASGGVEQPRGWLTGEEREAVETARDHFDDDDHGDSECVFIARMLKQILARSTPPKVKKPGRWRDDLYDGDQIVVGDQRDAEWLAALAAAGVAVEEVGK